MTDRIALVFAKSLGLILSKVPFAFLEKATEFLALLLMSIPNSRRRLLISNLRHAFPKWEYKKVLSVARESSARMFEMGFFSLCYPYMSKDQLRHTLFYDDDTEAKLEELRKTGKPVLMLIPHTCLFETLATSPFFRPLGRRSLGAIYRPNKNPLLDSWITKARRKVGIIPFSRKEGIIKARSHLKKGNWLAVLYDQNAGFRGEGSIFLDRICSLSPLPNLLSKNQDVVRVHAIAKRVGFFQSRLELKFINSPISQTAESAHQLLCDILNKCKLGFPEWLWSHGKWKINNMAHEIFLLQEKFQKLIFESKSQRSNIVTVRMPNWLGDIVMALPVIRAVRKGRPDAWVRLLCKPSYAQWLRELAVAEEVRSLPDAGGINYYKEIINKFSSYKNDVMLMLTNSLRGDLEAFLMGAKHRLGMELKGRRPLLNSKFIVPQKRKDEHQLSIWFAMLEKFSHFGPPQVQDFCYPFSSCDNDSKIVAVAPGSLNSPEKRLPTKQWALLIALISKYNSKVSFRILGTPTELDICSDLHARIMLYSVENLCGKTNLIELSEILKSSKCLLCNDSGAMHLANALGVPVFAVFSSTSPEKTGPVFNSPVKIHKIENDNFGNFNSEDEQSLKEGLMEFLEELG